MVKFLENGSENASKRKIIELYLKKNSGQSELPTSKEYKDITSLYGVLDNIVNVADFITNTLNLFPFYPVGVPIDPAYPMGFQMTVDKFIEKFKAYDIFPLSQSAVRMMKSVNANTLKQQDITQLSQYLQQISFKSNEIEPQVDQVVSVLADPKGQRAINNRFVPIIDGLKQTISQLQILVGNASPNKPQRYGSGLPARYY